MVGGSLRLLPPLITGRHDIAKILLKVVLNIKIQIQIHCHELNWDRKIICFLYFVCVFSCEKGSF